MIQTILLTFDVEDWFQVENFKGHIPFSSWLNCELRVEKNIHKILDLLDSIKLHYASRLTPHDSIRATFFVLGWIAECLPGLVREIHARGHEVASHGYAHMLCRNQSVDELKSDLAKSKQLLEDLIGNCIYGYRAPSFSIDMDVMKRVEEAGYLYDSSFNSFRLNRRYGQISLGDNGHNGVYHQISDNFSELPVSNLKIGNQVLPWGGGGYFRLIPLPLFKRGVEKILDRNRTYLFYLHPWEIDPDQPRVSGIAPSFKFRHYLNLDKTYGKLSMFLKSFEGCRFLTCMDFLREINASAHSPSQWTESTLTARQTQQTRQ